MGSYTWKTLPKPIQLGYFEPTLIRNKAHVKIRTNQLITARPFVYAVIVRILGDKVTNDELADFITANWGVHSPFNIKTFGDSFEVIFKMMCDHRRALKIEWAWIKHNLLVVLPKTPWMKPSEEVLNTTPMWVMLTRLKEKYWNDEIISRIVSTLGTPLNGHFSFESGKPTTVNLVVVIDGSF